MLAAALASRIDTRFLIDDFEPAYMQLYRRGELAALAETALDELADCCACPRNCHINRLKNETLICHTGRHAIVSSAFAHFGEEDCLRGWNGSGTIFFGLCNLRCVFCQNFEISQLGEGTEVAPATLTRLMLELQTSGCHNLNFVTPEHVVPQILEALVLAVERGLRLPLVYNTSAYDSPESLRLLDGLVDIYMPDFKLWRAEHCARYLGARNYAEAARTAIAVMHAQVGELKVDEQGLALRGMLVRHLVMPGLLDDTREILRWLATALSRDTYVNVMDQYHPAHQAATEPRLAPIHRRLHRGEFEQALEHARAAGLWRLDTRWS